jgi:hypothetical protein
VNHSPITIHYSLFTIHLSLFTIHLSLITLHYSLLLEILRGLIWLQKSKALKFLGFKASTKVSI